MPQRLQLTSIERHLVWLVAQVLLVGSVAWLAFQIQQERIAPAVLFPLVVGAVLGAGVWVISRALGAGLGRTTFIVALVSGLLVVVAQDYIGHRHRLRLYADEMSRRAPLSAAPFEGHDWMQPRFADYLAEKLRDEPVWWTLDAVLTSGAALAVVAWGLRSSRFTSLPPT